MKIKKRTISEAFKKARKQLNTCTFICNSLEKQGAFTPTVSICKRIIKERIQYSYTLEDWLMGQHNIYVIHVPHWEAEMLKYRHRWLDALIEEFDVDGDYEG
jgi:hypothetical protein